MYVFVCRCRVRGLDPVERGLRAVRVGGNGRLFAVHRNDGKRVQFTAGSDEIALEFLLRQQGDDESGKRVQNVLNGLKFLK